MAKRKRSATTLRVFELPLIATAVDIEEFFGMMLDTFMNRDFNGFSTKECYVRFTDETLAKEALKKDNEFILGCPVRVQKSSVPLESLRVKKQCSTLRALPFGRYDKRPVVNVINKHYPNLINPQSISVSSVHTSSSKSSLHKYALLTFVDSSTAEKVMDTYEEEIEKNPLTGASTMKREGINSYMKKCKKQLFWST